MGRRPKRLDAAPELFATGNGAPVVDAEIDTGIDAGRDGTADGRPAGGQGALVTTARAAVRDLDALLEDCAPDPTVLAAARSIARRLAVRRRSRDPRAEHRGGPFAPVPYAYRGDDIDLDRTVQRLASTPNPEDTDVVVRERRGARRAAVLVVDVSGSIRGEKARIAAATVAALAAELSGPGDGLALVAFWSDAAVLTTLAQPARPERLLDTLLRIPARGLTNVGFALSVAQAELARSSAQRKIAILLSDAVHNAGPDPRHQARRLAELHVLLETDGEHDALLGRDLARAGRGTVTPVRSHRDVAPALNRVMGR